MSLVSVVIPTKGRPELLKQALTSVLRQTLQDFEIIVVDDGEGADSICASFSDSRIRYLKNAPKKGAAAARNTGMREARGEFVAFLDDDDQWLPEKLAKQTALLEKASSKTVFCFSAVRNVYDDHEEITDVPAGEANFLERSLKRFSGFLTSTLVVRRKILMEAGGFDESLPSHQEPDLIIRLSENYDGIGIDEPLAVMNLSKAHEHISSDLSRRIAGREALLKKHAVLFSKRRRVLAKHYFRIGLWNRDSGRREEARAYFIRAARTSFSLRSLWHCLVP